MTHKVTINGHEDAADLLMLYGLENPIHHSGDKVIFSILIATDTRYSVTSPQVSVSNDGNEPGGRRVYSFIMPDADVEIDVSQSSSMMNLFTNGFPMPSMGMTMMDNMRMNNPSASDSADEIDSYPWEGKPKFCTECGVPTKGSNKFCRECGAPLVPKEEIT